MRKLGLVLLILTTVTVIFSGCQRESSIVDPQSLSASNLSTAIQLPAGATLQSATFSIYVIVPSNETVNIHRITQPWNEMDVSWNSFGGSYDATVAVSFIPNTVGWHSIDVTDLVRKWLDGSYVDNGLMLEQSLTPYTLYASSDNLTSSIRPKMEVCYSLSGGSVCETIQRGFLGEVSDAYIWQLYPDDKNGGSSSLYSGSVGGAEKMSLLKFNLTPTPPQPASLGDFVWYDVNDNGIQDAGETGVQDVTVSLMDCNGRVLASTITDANGYYLFSNLTPGDYNVHFVAPLGYVFSPRNVGDDALDSDVNPADGLTECTTLGSGENDRTWDAGLFLPPPPEGCSLTIGYWKTHAGFGPQPDHLTQFLPMWLGTAGGSRSINVSNVRIAYDILVMKTYGVPSNGITKLYAQMLAAKLNIANGASGSAVASTISAANAWLANHSWTEWSSLSKNTQKQVLGWMTTFDNYNNGLIGPGHCDIIGDGNDI
jgi:hypothetical protein